MSVKVLVVDDHDAFRRAVVTMLSSAGYEVVGEAVDGAGALEAARTMAPDIVLLDVRLPDIDGIDVAARLPPEPGGPKVVLVSSLEPIDFAERLSASRARGFIPKRALSAARFAELVGAP